MSRRPSLLLITNEEKVGDATGQIDGYKLLASTGELDRVEAISAKEGFEDNPALVVENVLEAIDQTRPDVVLVWTPGLFPGSRGNFEKILEAIGSARLVYWEGDAWHKAKRMTNQMRWWMGASEVVFSTAGPPQATDYLAAGAKAVWHTPATYCHLKFRACEERDPPPVESRRVTMLGNNLMRVPGVTGLPGSVRRAELAWRLRSSLDDFDLRGNGWKRVGITSQPLAYHLQAEHIRSGAVSVGWDHFPYLPDYSSDRLPIALIAGRPHVTTVHPGMSWAPGEDVGLFQRGTPDAIVHNVRDLLSDVDGLTELGRAAHRWAAHRVSHREAARHLMSICVESVRRPPADPWDALPGPWTSGS